jgi:hypothetical protein
MLASAAMAGPTTGFSSFGGTGYYYGARAPHYGGPAYGYGRPGSPFGFGNPHSGVLGYDYGGAYSRSWSTDYAPPSPSGVYGPYAPGAYGYYAPYPY